MESQSQLDELLTRDQAAEYLAITPATLARWASRGTGPNFVRVGRLARYRTSDLNDFLSRHEVRQRAAS